ncbi:hypothetical protein BKG82_26140 [Mycobacteroides chelonae]|uniref:NlpC/P60 domain-containing protein n=1 Tax=Mycobacteroides chelonae TaxID=1774 RepID=A0A1S1LFT5_MYCCH|nr:NlpC/P60 family protein [Mycobacteroides chelonae]OHU47141.1 hypothetical protein BKG82_26140 [Mycobacteroides chelonae]
MASIGNELRRVANELIARGTPFAHGGGGIEGPSRGVVDGGSPADRAGDYLKEGFDAGSLAQYVIHKVFGVKIPRTTFEQRRFGTIVAGPDAGDLVYPAAYGGGYATVFLGDGTVLAATRSGELIRTEPFTPVPTNEYVRVVNR